MPQDTLYVSKIVDNQTGLEITAEELVKLKPTEIPENGWFDYNDLNTVTNPILLTTDNTFVKLTNDTLGPFTNNSFKPNDVPSVWNSVTNQFDWTALELGDMVDLRVDVEVTTTSPNQTVDLELFLGVGDANEYPIPFTIETEKNAGSVSLNRWNGINMGNTLTRDNPAEFRIKSDDNLSVVVRGWYVRIIKKT